MHIIEFYLIFLISVLADINSHHIGIGRYAFSHIFIKTALGSSYCTSWNFRGGFIFANFASQTLAKISTSIYVYL